jgi:hypothetical protein
MLRRQTSAPFPPIPCGGISHGLTCTATRQPCTMMNWWRPCSSVSTRSGLRQTVIVRLRRAYGFRSITRGAAIPMGSASRPTLVEQNARRSECDHRSGKLSQDKPRHIHRADS